METYTSGPAGVWTTCGGRRSWPPRCELIREHGLWDVRLADVAKRAGISATSVVYYFGSKDQLFAQAIAEADDAFYEPLLAELAGLEQRGGADRVAVRALQHQRLAAVDGPVGLLAPPSRDGDGPAPLPRALAARRSPTSSAHGCRRGEWSVADPDAVALRLSALTDGLAVHMVLGDAEHTPEALRGDVAGGGVAGARLRPRRELERAARRSAAPPR